MTNDSRREGEDGVNSCSVRTEEDAIIDPEYKDACGVEKEAWIHFTLAETMVLEATAEVVPPITCCGAGAVEVLFEFEQEV
jgi:hypothetical protein